MSSEPKASDKVLVVDDTPETLSFLTDALELAGHTALVATSGESALTLLRQITPDIILMDAIMPGIDGFETCRRLKREQSSAHIPVIFMTALNETEHVVKGLNAGGVDYLTKPIIIDELLARIRVHLANARITFGARMALDAAGRCLLAVNEAGHRLWCTPQAERILKELYPELSEGGDALPPPVLEGVRRLRQISGEDARSFTVSAANRHLNIAYLSRTGPDELLFQITEAIPGNKELILKQTLGLTSREAEVLLWISAGKSNRDISDILGISPRTVNKHLEQIFTKLGVENRAAAAVITVRTLQAANG